MLAEHDPAAVLDTLRQGWGRARRSAVCFVAFFPPTQPSPRLLYLLDSLKMEHVATHTQRGRDAWIYHLFHAATRLGSQSWQRDDRHSSPVVWKGGRHSLFPSPPLSPPFPGCSCPVDIVRSTQLDICLGYFRHWHPSTTGGSLVRLCAAARSTAERPAPA